MTSKILPKASHPPDNNASSENPTSTQKMPPQDEIRDQQQIPVSTLSGKAECAASGCSDGWGGCLYPPVTNRGKAPISHWPGMSGPPSAIPPARNKISYPSATFHQNTPACIFYTEQQNSKISVYLYFESLRLQGNNSSIMPPSTTKSDFLTCWWWWCQLRNFTTKATRYMYAH